MSDLNETAAKEAAEQLSARGRGKAIGVAMDVTDEEMVVDTVRAVREEHGKLDIMVNNAGIDVTGLVEDLQLAHWKSAIDVNVYGVIHGVHAAYPIMLEQGSGHIVNIASVASLVNMPLLTAYNMSKHAVLGLSLSLRAEAASRGVKVTAICPGRTATNFTTAKGLPPIASFERLKGKNLNLKPPKHKPEHLAEVVMKAMDKNKALVVSPRGTAFYAAILGRFKGINDWVGRDVMRQAVKRGILG
ncbi:NAD(P)-dependent dehydrogenase (short-subunit alcohol dehydrogenase family) [Crossiella equi]|uniref:NAD(P)-dependent dehydrogenase (Short-subunit alcohol dehydrogenase family) n=1 Tax=Crossiella equi TaxID=130796 RepID=A0ABS5AKJ6_9PSEU|nr:NAD(P)-dependent dehydrogenase (short-subunit alcohol dehydrogenase family) [Crossiella equi]